MAGDQKKKTVPPSASPGPANATYSSIPFDHTKSFRPAQQSNNVATLPPPPPAAAARPTDGTVTINVVNSNKKAQNTAANQVKGSQHQAVAATNLAPTTAPARAVGSAPSKIIRKKAPSSASTQGTSAFRGVTKHRITGRYEAHFWDSTFLRPPKLDAKGKQVGRLKGRQVYIGGYNDEEDAARAYDKAAIAYLGPTANTNFPLSEYTDYFKEINGRDVEDIVGQLRRGSTSFARGISKFRGVSKHHSNGKWEARIGKVNGDRVLHLGVFDNPEEAAVAYDKAWVKFKSQGKQGITNFPLAHYYDILSNPDCYEAEKEAKKHGGGYSTMQSAGNAAESDEEKGGEEYNFGPPRPKRLAATKSAFRFDTFSGGALGGGARRGRKNKRYYETDTDTEEDLELSCSEEEKEEIEEASRGDDDGEDEQEQHQQAGKFSRRRKTRGSNKNRRLDYVERDSSIVTDDPRNPLVSPRRAVGPAQHNHHGQQQQLSPWWQQQLQLHQPSYYYNNDGLLLYNHLYGLHLPPSPAATAGPGTMPQQQQPLPPPVPQSLGSPSQPWWQANTMINPEVWLQWNSIMQGQIQPHPGLAFSLPSNQHPVYHQQQRQQQYGGGGGQHGVGFSSHPPPPPSFQNYHSQAMPPYRYQQQQQQQQQQMVQKTRKPQQKKVTAEEEEETTPASKKVQVQPLPRNTKPVLPNLNARLPLASHTTHPTQPGGAGGAGGNIISPLAASLLSPLGLNTNGNWKDSPLEKLILNSNDESVLRLINSMQNTNNTHELANRIAGVAATAAAGLGSPPAEHAGHDDIWGALQWLDSLDLAQLAAGGARRGPPGNDDANPNPNGNGGGASGKGDGGGARGGGHNTKDDE